MTPRRRERGETWTPERQRRNPWRTKTTSICGSKGNWQGVFKGKIDRNDYGDSCASWFEVLSATMPKAQTAPKPPKSPGSEQTFKDVQMIVVRVADDSLAFAKAFSSVEPLDSVEIEFTYLLPHGDEEVYVRCEMKDVVITSYNKSWNGGAGASVETMVFSAKTVDMIRPVDRDGGNVTTSSIPRGWNQTTNSNM
jgi:hypothetical protein